MSPIDLRSEVVASPCNLVCTIDPATGWCLGCGRSLDEIAEWGVAKPARRQAILAGLTKRMRHLALRRR